MADASFSICRCFSNLRDPRIERGKKHLLLDIIPIALCGVIAGANDWPQIETFGRTHRGWLQRFLSLPNGIPSHDTIERVFARLSPVAFQRCFLRWLHALAKGLGEGHFAIDGKTLRSSGSAAGGLGPLHLVSVWATQAKLSLGQLAVGDKSNEITAIPTLLELLDLRGALVTIDAMGCQKEIARGVVAGSGDYVLTVKDNQPHLLEDIRDTMVRAIEVDFQGFRHEVFVSEEDGHGRHARREYTVLYDVSGIRDRELWPKLTVVGTCYSERTVGGKTSDELRFFIGSRDAGAKAYGQALRAHWGIENNLHWQLDVTFREDANRVQQRNAAQNLALLRKVALSLLQRHPRKASIANKRLEAAYDTNFLDEILEGVKT